MTIRSYDDSFDMLFALAARRAVRVVGNPGIAEELAQDTMLRALAAWDEIHAFAERWVSRVAVNRSIDHLRRQRRTSQFLPLGDRDLTSADVSIDLRSAVNELPARQREVVVLRHLADLSERDVAELLGITTGSVKRHLARAVAALRRSPLLTESELTRTEEDEAMLTDWREMFTEASPPQSGWPARPWDHRYLCDDAGSVDRVAVDQSGRIILDADGDEVQSGPGFNYHAAKVLRRGVTSHQRWVAPTDGMSDTLAALLRRAGELADVVGHPWVGEEHLGLAILEMCPEWETVLGASWDVLLQAVAEFYEGPDAKARVSLVHDRLQVGWRPLRLEGERLPEPNYSLKELLLLTVDEATAQGEEATIEQAAKQLVAPADASGRKRFVSALLSKL